MDVRELTSAPDLTTRLYPQALAGAVAVPFLRRVPVIGGGLRKKDLPDTALELRDVEVDRGHLREYNDVCGLRMRDELPPTYPHMLAFPLSMQLMTDPSFPFSVIGLVHVQNRITQARPIRVDERLRVRAHAEDLAPHDKGTQFVVVGEAYVGDESVWVSRSTYLHKEGGGPSGDKERERDDVPPRPKAVWSVPGDIGRRYGGVSGDRNPIHLHPLSARLFGMPKPIAHGMWLKARCLAAFEGKLPAAYTVDVRFKLPVFIPTKVAFSAAREDGGFAFEVRDAKSGKPHLSGTVAPT